MFSIQFSFVSLALCAVLGLCGCGEQTVTDESVLIMGTSADMPPFEFYQGQEIVGYDIDVARAVAGVLGKTLVIRDMDFSALIPALQAGRVHMVMASMTPTPERRQAISFSNPYLTLPVCVLSLDTQDFATPKGFQNKVIGVQLGSTHEQYAKKMAETDKTMTVKSLNKLSELVEELKTKRLDGIIMETTTALSFTAHHPNLRVHTLTDAAISFSLALPKDSALRNDINKALETLKASGDLITLREQWFKGL